MPRATQGAIAANWLAPNNSPQHVTCKFALCVPSLGLYWLNHNKVLCDGNDEDTHLNVWRTLTYPSLAPHICAIGSALLQKMVYRLSDAKLYLNRCWVIVHWTLGNNLAKTKWNFNQNKKFYIHVNASENIVSEMAAFLSREIWVKYVISKALSLLRLSRPE